MHELIASLLALLVIVYAFAYMLGRRNIISGGLAGLARWFGWLLVRSVYVLVLFVVNTWALLFRLAWHIRYPDRIPDDFARYIERMTDAVMGRYGP